MFFFEIWKKNIKYVFSNTDWTSSSQDSRQQQDNSTGLQLPMTATTSYGQQAKELSLAAVHDCNGLQPSSSHSTGTSTNVDGWTSDELQHLSIYASAGAQQRNMDKRKGWEPEVCSTRHSSKYQRRYRLYGVETCDPDAVPKVYSLQF